MIGIEDGHLAALPLYLEHYIPDWDRLPMFVLRMCTEVRHAGVRASATQHVR